MGTSDTRNKSSVSDGPSMESVDDKKPDEVGDAMPEPCSAF